MEKYKVGIVTISDRVYRKEKEDLAGPLLKKIVEENGYEVAEERNVPDEIEKIKEVLINLSDDENIALIFTTGGTGFAKRDVTPEATISVSEKIVPGIGEAMRAYSAKITNRAYLSRATSGIRKNSLIINLPGSPKALKENLEALFSFLDHGLEILRGDAKDCCAK